MFTWIVCRYVGIKDTLEADTRTRDYHSLSQIQATPQAALHPGLPQPRPDPGHTPGSPAPGATTPSTRTVGAVSGTLLPH